LSEKDENNDNKNKSNKGDNIIILNKSNRGWEDLEKSPVEHFRTNKDNWADDNDDIRYIPIIKEKKSNKKEGKKKDDEERIENKDKIKNKKMIDEKETKDLLDINLNEKINDDFENSYIFQSKLLDIKNECLKHGFVMGYSLIRISDFLSQNEIKKQEINKL